MLLLLLRRLLQLHCRTRTFLRVLCLPVKSCCRCLSQLCTQRRHLQPTPQAAACHKLFRRRWSAPAFNQLRAPYCTLIETISSATMPINGDAAEPSPTRLAGLFIRTVTQIKMSFIFLIGQHQPIYLLILFQMKSSDLLVRVSYRTALTMRSLRSYSSAGQLKEAPNPDQVIDHMLSSPGQDGLFKPPCIPDHSSHPPPPPTWGAPLL